MPKSQWLQGAELIPENAIYKVDGSSRIIIPAHMRNKFKIDLGDMVEYYTAFIDGKWFLCACRASEEEQEKEREREREREEKKRKMNEECL